MTLTRLHIRQFIALTAWLARTIAAAARSAAPVAVISGVSAKLLQLASFAGTFQIVAMVVLARIREQPIDLPVISDIGRVIGVGPGLGAAMLAIAVLYTLAGLANATTATFLARTQDRTAQALMRQVLARRLVDEAYAQNAAPAVRKAFNQFAKNEYPKKYNWTCDQVGLLLSMIQTGAVSASCMALLAYFVPTLTLMLVPLLLVFLLLTAPAVYHREKQTEAALKAQRSAVTEERQQLAETYVSAAQGMSPNTLLDQFLEPPSRSAMAAAERRRNRVRRLSDTLKLAMVMATFLVVLGYLHQEGGSLTLGSGESIIRIVIVLLTIRFTLIYFRNFIGTLFNYNGRFWRLQKLYTDATGQAPARAGRRRRPMMALPGPARPR